MGILEPVTPGGLWGDSVEARPAPSLPEGVAGGLCPLSPIQHWPGCSGTSRRFWPGPWHLAEDRGRTGRLSALRGTVGPRSRPALWVCSLHSSAETPREGPHSV